MRLRFCYTKLGKIRFTSQRDVARMWERALRRMNMPVGYSEGFNPRPLLSFGLALPTGAESRAEYVDVVVDDAAWQEAGRTTDDLPSELTGLLPEGIDVVDVEVVERQSGSLQQFVTSCSWLMEFTGVTVAGMGALIDAVLAAETIMIMRERKGRQETDDLRPSIIALGLAEGPFDQGGEAAGRGDEGSPVAVVAELATKPRGVRPVELVRAFVAVAGGAADDQSERWATLGGAAQGTPVLHRACRTQQWIQRDDVPDEAPVPSDPARGDAGAEHVLERAS